MPKFYISITLTYHTLVQLTEFDICFTLSHFRATSPITPLYGAREILALDENQRNKAK